MAACILIVVVAIVAGCYAYPPYHRIETRQLFGSSQGHPPAIFPALSLSPSTESATSTLNPFRPMPGIRVTLIDRNELIDRLIHRLESLRVVPEGTPQTLPIRADVINADGSPTTGVVGAATPLQAQSPLVAIANFFDRLFSRQPGYQDSQHQAQGQQQQAPAKAEAPAHSVAEVTDKKIETQEADKPVATEEQAPVAADATASKDAPQVVEVIPYKAGALVHKPDGSLVYQPTYTSPEQVSGSTSQEYFLGYIAPSRPTIRQSFQELFNIQEGLPSTPLLSGAPGYQNVHQQNVPVFFYRHF